MELNTPISAILANIEMIDKSLMDNKNLKKISRIEIAAKTVSLIYQDLTYLILGHQKNRRDEWIDIRRLILDRVEYFKTLAESKKVQFELELEEYKLFVDVIKITRVVDNLISNAIKYNKRRGEVKVILKKDLFLISDTGVGIKADRLEAVFDRYSRFNQSVGGFGIGLNIVKSIIDEYGYKITVRSKVGKGTTFTIFFKQN